MENPELHRLLERGEDYFARGDLSEAKRSFETVLTILPNHKEAWNNLGVIAFQEGRHHQASESFLRALEADPSYMEAIENLARCSMARGEYAEAVNALQKAYDLGHSDPSFLNLMAQCFMRLGDDSAARDLLNASLQKDPEQAEVSKLLESMEKKKLRIGFVSVWFERGQAYVTKAIRDALARDHDTFLFARTGAVYGERKLETDHFWKIPNLTAFPDYKIPPDVLTSWIRKNRLDAVVFNEEYDWKLVQAARGTGVPTITYLDYYKEEWKPLMRLYDAVFCSTLRTYHLVKEFCTAVFVGWAVDADLFRPRDDGEVKHTFFHNAGWLGINYRKMTPAVVLAFDAVCRHIPDATLFIHSQAGIEKLPPVTIRTIQGNPRITYHVETVPAPGLYHKGRILLFPSKLEGLGLPLPEGLACGLPAIATDAPPMNEFVKDGYNGLLIRVA
ncbi:MAG: tetratricopeptide repeat protein, partial [Desulfobacteraceae bacterium]